MEAVLDSSNRIGFAVEGLEDQIRNHEQKLKKAEQKLLLRVDKLQQKLQSASFLSKAPSDVILSTERSLLDAKKELQELQESIKQFERVCKS